MHIKEIPNHIFDEYALKHPLGSFHQSSNYALLMAEQDFDYDCIGMYDDFGNILAASLILHKKVSMFSHYGYAPKGFLVDYYNKPLLEKFTTLIKEYYGKKGFAFIKINPEIAVGEVNFKQKYQIDYNQNRLVSTYLENLGYKKFKKTADFNTKLPRYNAILPLKTFDIKNTSKNTRNKIRNGMRKGLVFERGNRESINILYDFIKNKKTRELLYYKDIFNVFDRSNMVDVFLVKVHYQDYLTNIKYMYEYELEKNSELNEKLTKNPSTTNINLKMQSDKNLNAYHDNMIEASKGLQNKKEVYIAGAITIRYKDRVNILISGFDKSASHFNANYFLHYMIFNYYKDDFDFIDLNGISGNFDHTNKYRGLNRFKLNWNPKVFEFIGEYDLVINENAYMNLTNSKKLSNEFDIK